MPLIFKTQLYAASRPAKFSYACWLAGWLVFAAAWLTPMSGKAGTITVLNSQAGTTPLRLGYNLGHFMQGSNTADWFRYAGVDAARVFISPSDIEPTDDTSSYGDGVNSEASFFSRRTLLRTNAASSSATLSNTYVRWSTFSNHYSDVPTSGNRIKYSYALGNLRDRGVAILANITASPSSFPITGDSDWAGKWEMWQHYYAQAFLLSRDYGVQNFGMFNEPNNWSGMTEADWFMRYRFCSDAIQCAVADMNSRYSKALVPQVFAPNTSNGAEKYNTSTDTWGRDSVTNRHLKIDGSTASSWMNLHVYNYQKYTTRTNASGSLSGYIDDYDAIRGYINEDMPGESMLPMALTEFNVRTGASYDSTTETQDSPSDYSALAANCIALTSRGVNQLYLFKFGQTSSNSTYGVAKNGTHYVENSTGSGDLNNYGGATKCAEVYRLFTKAARGARPRLDFNTTSSVSPTNTAGVWSMVTYDSIKDTYYLFTANKGSSSVSLDVDLSALSLPATNPYMVEEVSGNTSGGVLRMANLISGKVPTATMPAQSVWLITIPKVSLSFVTQSATADTQLGDGVSKSLSGGNATQMQVRADGTADGRRVSLIRIPIPAASSPNNHSTLLRLDVATSSGTDPIQAHVYGVSDNSWIESSATWAGATSLLRQNVVSGNEIAHNIIAGQGTTTQMLGQIVANSTVASECCLDVTDFVKSRSDGFASFLVVQEHRWDVAQPSLTVGDTQPAGLVISSKEFNNIGPRLTTLTADTPPAFALQPQSVKVDLGSQVVFTVTVTGTAPITYQWRKNGINLAGATLSSLTIASAADSDVGSYDVVLNNIAGSATSTAATLEINGVPSAIVSQPLPVTISSGETATLSVVASGTAPLVYQWYQGAPGITTTPVGSNSPNFNTPPLASTTSYWVKVTNASNTAGANSTEAKVTVTPAALFTGTLASWDIGTSVANAVTSTSVSPLISTGVSAASAINLYGNYVPSSGTTSSSGWKWFDNASVTGLSASMAAATPKYFGFTLSALSNYSLSISGLGPTSFFRGSSAPTNLAFLYSATNTWTAGNYRIIAASVSIPTSSSDLSSTLTGDLAANPVTINSSGTGYFRIYYWGGSSSTTSGAIWVGTDPASDFSLTGTASPNLVATLPTIDSQPVSATVNRGQPVTLSVAVSGSAPLTYQWLKDGVSILAANSDVFSIASASPSDAGDYQVRVSNDAGSVTSAVAKVTVNVPPEITSQPQSRAVNAGGQASFSVVATGTAPFTYQWQKNGSNIAAANASSYDIFNVAVADAASYRVIVSNATGNATSAVATLAVNEVPIITAQPQSSTVNEGAVVTFSVTAAGTAPLSYQWQKDGQDIAMANTSSYVISGVTAADAGDYQVSVDNAAGGETSAVATLAVNVGPTLTTQPESLTVNAGASATFSVSASGTGPLTYQWQKNGVNIEAAVASSYTISAATATDAASYRVIVGNVVGSMTSVSATLLVNLPPTITIQPQSIAVNAGTQVAFTVAATGTGPLTYQWLKGGSAIPLANAASFSIPVASVSDAGDYRVIVSNVAGSATSTIASLGVNSQPTISQIADQSLSEDSATPALAFTVGDAETAVGSLVVTAVSSNTSLVPFANIVLNGSGAERTVTVTPLANQSGSTVITITVSDGVVSTAEVFLLVVSPDTPWTNWKQSEFGVSWQNSVLAGNTSDPDRDGVSNLLEYALGGQPLVAQNSILPTVRQVIAGAEFRFSRNLLRTDLVISVQFANDLTGTWTTVATSTNGNAMTSLIQGVSVTENSGSPLREVTAVEARSSSVTKRFMRLRVELLAP